MLQMVNHLIYNLGLQQQILKVKIDDSIPILNSPALKLIAIASPASNSGPP